MVLEWDIITSFPEEKRIIISPEDWMLLAQVIFDHHLE